MIKITLGFSPRNPLITYIEIQSTIIRISSMLRMVIQWHHSLS